ncbi:MAG: putative metal-dependent enzyme (double-stranded beta helix superfamily) [Hyphomicrobiaceae bacterium]|jgi:predicted metal-dependent enzyme (double-stranded beta helix superfamily)
MLDSDYSLENYVEDLRAIAAAESDPTKVAEKVKPFAKKLAAAPGWLKDEYRGVNEAQGYGVHLLHEEDNHDLAVFVLTWMPGRGTMPHNHMTWAVVAGIEGQEQETEWNRADDGSKEGYAKLEKVGEHILVPGQVTACKPQDIHSVFNPGTEISISLHTYGRHLNHTGRSEFDPSKDLERPFEVAVSK